MINFKQFLGEEAKPSKLKHIHHLEDHILHGGHEGVGVAAQHLDDVHDHLLGNNIDSHISEKFDGAPSVIFGHHPETGKFFVATKSAFNVTPKINYTKADIEKNHGHAPGLVEKLNSALDHLPKVMPRNGGVYQGDMMYTKSDIKRKDNKYHFTPNTVTYSTPQDSKHGKSIRNSEIGFVAHTQYKGGKKLDEMTAHPLDEKSRGKFQTHPDVHNIDPTIDVNPTKYTTAEQQAFLNHKESARMAYSKMKPEAMDALEGHGHSLVSHINKTVRVGDEPSVEGYLNHLSEVHDNELKKIKVPETRSKKAQDHASVLQHVTENQNHFSKALEVHKHLQNAKNVLTTVLGKNSQFETTIGDTKVGPEGAVLVDKKGNVSKLVNRTEFSKANMSGVGAIAKAKAKK